MSCADFCDAPWQELDEQMADGEGLVAAAPLLSLAADGAADDTPRGEKKKVRAMLWRALSQHTAMLIRCGGLFLRHKHYISRCELRRTSSMDVDWITALLLLWTLLCNCGDDPGLRTQKKKKKKHSEAAAAAE